MDSGGLVIPHPIHMPRRNPIEKDSKLNNEDNYRRTVTHRKDRPKLWKVIPNFFASVVRELKKVESNVSRRTFPYSHGV